MRDRKLVFNKFKLKYANVRLKKTRNYGKAGRKRVERYKRKQTLWEKWVIKVKRKVLDKRILKYAYSGGREISNEQWSLWK